MTTNWVCTHYKQNSVSTSKCNQRELYHNAGQTDKYAMDMTGILSLGCRFKVQSTLTLSLH